MSNIKAATDELHVAFRHLNDQFFNGELPEPAITIQTSGNRTTMAWCSTRKIWLDASGTIRKYELNISAEYLNIEFYETMDSMLHEMVHLYCKIKNIKDTSRGGTYHNKRFKEECLRRGFYYLHIKPDPKYGWAFPKITEETKRIIDTFPVKRDAFKIARATFGRLISGDAVVADDYQIEPEEGGEEKRKTNIIKWICPSCLTPVRSSKMVNISCIDCDEVFIQA
ncbi:SprT-like domain-containing protein [Paenibacillus elgii]|uniref:SprT-like domain-containing protein n=1 Tax=Paenibacillus elgii TaxID=189691 RepID=UPI0013D5D501|nr:SprT-like domain-containing protein [Paenibacillus elgii]